MTRRRGPRTAVLTFRMSDKGRAAGPVTGPAGDAAVRWISVESIKAQNRFPERRRPSETIES